MQTKQKSRLAEWLKNSELPHFLPMLDEKFGWEKHFNDAISKRTEVVNWLNAEIKLAFSQKNGQQAPERFYMLKHFATAVRTSYNKRVPEWWLARLKIIPEDIYCEYVAQRRARETVKLDRKGSK